MTDGPRLQAPRRNNDPDGYSQIVQRYVKLKQDVSDMQSAILKSAGLSAEPGLLVVNGDLSVPSGKITLAGVDQDLAAALAKLGVLSGGWRANRQDPSGVGGTPGMDILSGSLDTLGFDPSVIGPTVTVTTPSGSILVLGVATVDPTSTGGSTWQGTLTVSVEVRSADGATHLSTAPDTGEITAFGSVPVFTALSLTPGGTYQVRLRYFCNSVSTPANMGSVYSRTLVAWPY